MKGALSSLLPPLNLKTQAWKESISRPTGKRLSTGFGRLLLTRMFASSWPLRFCTCLLSSSLDSSSLNILTYKLGGAPALLANSLQGSTELIARCSNARNEVTVTKAWEGLPQAAPDLFPVSLVDQESRTVRSHETKHLKALEISEGNFRLWASNPGFMYKVALICSHRGMKIRLTKKTFLPKLKAPPHPTKGHSTLWFIQARHSGTCHLWNKRHSLREESKDSLLNQQEYLPWYVGLKSKREKTKTHLIVYSRKSLNGENVLLWPQESHLLRTWTQDNLNSLCFLWRNCLFNKRKILRGLSEIFRWSLTAAKRCMLLPRVSRRCFHFNIPWEVISASLLSRFLHSFLNGWFVIGNWVVLKGILSSKRKPRQLYFWNYQHESSGLSSEEETKEAGRYLWPDPWLPWERTLALPGKDSELFLVLHHF